MRVPILFDVMYSLNRKRVEETQKVARSILARLKREVKRSAGGGSNLQKRAHSVAFAGENPQSLVRVVMTLIGF